MFTLLASISALSTRLRFISNKTIECLKVKDKEDRYEFFDAIEHPNIKPVKLTASSAVFYDKYRNQIIKRIVKKKGSPRKEEVYCNIFKHPNLLTTYEVVHEPSYEKYADVYYIISEYLNQPINFRSVRKRENVIRDICHDVLKGLKHMHDMDYAHLDMKTNNIMGNKDRNGKITYKIIDFGFVRRIKGDDILDLKNKYYGSFPFSAPEVYYDCIYSKKSDIWGLGCIACFSTTNVKAFYDEDDRDIEYYEKFLDGNIHIRLNGMSREFNNFVKRCLTIDYNKRPSADELLKDPFITGIKK